MEWCQIRVKVELQNGGIVFETSKPMDRKMGRRITNELRAVGFEVSLFECKPPPKKRDGDRMSTQLSLFAPEQLRTVLEKVEGEFALHGTEPDR